MCFQVNWLVGLTSLKRWSSQENYRPCFQRRCLQCIIYTEILWILHLSRCLWTLVWKPLLTKLLSWFSWRLVTINLIQICWDASFRATHQNQSVVFRGSWWQFLRKLRWTKLGHFHPVQRCILLPKFEFLPTVVKWGRYSLAHKFDLSVTIMENNCTYSLNNQA